MKKKQAPNNKPAEQREAYKPQERKDVLPSALDSLMAIKTPALIRAVGMLAHSLLIFESTHDIQRKAVSE